MAKKKNPQYNLRIAEFDNSVTSFVSSLSEGIRFEKIEQPKLIIYRFYNEAEKRPVSILNCFIKNGPVSFLANGRTPVIAEDCKNYLIQNTVIEIGKISNFTVKPTTKDELDLVKIYLSDECEYKIESSVINDPHIVESFKIIGPYDDTVTFNYYSTGTLLAQGRPCLVFYSFLDIATEIFNPDVIKKEHFKLLESTIATDIIDTNLSNHIPAAYDSIGAKLDAIMTPSLILLNNPLVLSDFSAFAFPALRGIEGVLKKIFGEYDLEVKNFKEYFKTDVDKHKIIWAKDTSSLFPGDLGRNLLYLYRHYHFHRHSTFHVDVTIVSTRTLNYSEASDIVKKSLELINNVYLEYNKV